MAKTKISEYDAVASNNTDVDSVNIAEGCAPSGINNAIREVMAHLKDFQQGANGDPFNGPVNGTVGATTPAAGSFTNLTATGTVTIPDNAISGDKVEGGTINAITINTLTATNGASVQGLTVGRGAGAVSTNTAVGASALAGNTTGSSNTGVGYFAGWSTTGGTYVTALGRSSLPKNTTGSYNTAVGGEALFENTTASNNTAVGYQAGYSNTTGAANTFLGYQAGYTNNTGTTTGNTFVGAYAGYASTGVGNTFIGGNVTDSGIASGIAMTTGSKNTILGNYTGNQGGLDIRTANNYIVLSDGDGNPRVVVRDNGRADFFTGLAANSTDTTFVVWNTTGADVILEASNSSPTAISGTMRIAKNASNSRSINAAGTVNQNGADYAEYMVKAGDFTIAKGDLCGINAEGKLTNVFADAVSFCVKSTDPGLVGGDSWFTEPRPVREDGNEATKETPEYKEWFARMESARATVDRIAFCGQIPVNVTGAIAGQYIVPVNDNGSIKGQAVSNPTFEQYQSAVGKVIAIEEDGRARIIVKVA